MTREEAIKQAEIDVATAAIMKANEDTSVINFSDLLRTFAKVAIEAVDRYRGQIRHLK